MLVTVPVPVPAFVTVNDRATGAVGLNVAVTAHSHSASPHTNGPGTRPVQPVNVEPAAATAVNVTAVPFAKLARTRRATRDPGRRARHRPGPGPRLRHRQDRATGAVGLNVAVTAAFAFSVTAHEPVPVHSPVQPVNVEPAAATAVNVTAVPVVKNVLHTVPQETPAGVLVTVPVPVPAFVTVSPMTPVPIRPIALPLRNHMLPSGPSVIPSWALRTFTP